MLKVYLLIAFLSITPLGAVADFFYPFAAYVEIEESKYPIVGVKKSKPIVVIDGKRSRVAPEEVSFERVDLYQDGVIVELKEGGNFSPLAGKHLDDASRGREFKLAVMDVTIQASRPFDNLYCLVFLGHEDEILKGRNLDSLVVSYHEIGKVEAGKPKKLNLRSQYYRDMSLLPDDESYFIAYFENGLPVMDQSSAIASNYLMQRDFNTHRILLEQYVSNNAGAALKEQPYICFTPYLPKQMYEEYGAVNCVIEYWIEADGRVKVHTIKGMEEGAARDFIWARMEEWLFFPKLVDGEPTRVAKRQRIQY